MKNPPGSQNRPCGKTLSQWAGWIAIVSSWGAFPPMPERLEGGMTGTLPEPFAGWFAARGWRPRPHQLAMLEAAQAGESVLLIAPTGGGKTLAGFLPSLVALAAEPQPGLHTVYISPLKALTTDVARNLLQP